MITLVASFLLPLGAITSVEQTAYDQYTVVATALSSPGALTLHDPEGDEIPSTTAGDVLTVSSSAHYNNVASVKQVDGSGDEVDSMNFYSFHALLTSTAACCRVPLDGSTDASSSFQVFTPRMSLSGNQLTITANRVASVLTYATVEGGVVLAADRPASVADPGATYTRTVPIPASALDGGALASGVTLRACALLSDEEETCTTIPYASPSPPTPPLLPPVPPSNPPSPPTPPTPPPPQSPPPSAAQLGWEIVVAVVGGVLGLSLIVCAVWWVSSKKKHAPSTKAVTLQKSTATKPDETSSATSSATVEEGAEAV